MVNSTLYAVKQLDNCWYQKSLSFFYKIHRAPIFSIISIWHFIYEGYIRVFFYVSFISTCSLLESKISLAFRRSKIFENHFYNIVFLLLAGYWRDYKQNINLKLFINGQLIFVCINCCTRKYVIELFTSISESYS